MPVTSRTAARAEAISSGSNGIGSMRQRCSHSTLQPSASAAACEALRASASIEASVAASRWRWSIRIAVSPGTAVTTPGLHCASPIVHTPWWRIAISRSSSAKRAAARNESRRCAIGVEPAWAACPRKIARWRSTPTVPSTVPTARPSCSSTGPLLDVQLEVRAHVREAAARGARVVELDAVLAHHVLERGCRRRRAGRARRPDRACRPRPSCRRGCGRSAPPPRRPSPPASACTAGCPAAARRAAPRAPP